MVKIFVLLKITPGLVNEVESVMRAMPKIEEFHLLTGRYDAIAILDFPTVGEALECISNDIMMVNGIKDTETLVELPPF